MPMLTDFIASLRESLFTESERCVDSTRVQATPRVKERYHRQGRRLTVASLCISVLMSGCSATQKAVPQDLQWADGEKPVSWYKGHNTAIEHPALDNETAESVQVTHEPRSLQRRIEDEVREVTLEEVVLISLQNNKVIESTQLGGARNNLVLNSPDAVGTVYDSAIQETGILFGRRGIEAALADFDTRFSTALTFGQSSRGIHALPAPGISSQETGNFRTGLDKSLATGGAVSVYHDWNYTGDPSGAPTFASSYAGSIGAELRQPLLAGAGTEFTRVAGPSRPGFAAISGVSQGVVIARINQDISLADFDMAVRNGIRDVENAYWSLYLAYRAYDSTVTAHESAFQTWREARTKVEVGTLKLAEELQAKEEFYRTRAEVERTLSAVYKQEAFLRRALALPLNDGTVLRPSVEPVKAEFKPDWESCLLSGLTNRTELRRQKWQIKSLQLQLNAARSLVRPQVDLVGNYGVNGFGDTLISRNRSSGYGSMSRDDLETWTMGVEMSMPIGFRQARAQVRNYELLLTRANAILAAQERAIAYDISLAIQEVSEAWAQAQSNLNRLLAAERRVELLQAEQEVGTTTLDLVLRAQASRAQAEQDYYSQIVAYNNAITFLHFSTGSLLEVNNIQLEEGAWESEAYADAEMRAVERTHAKDSPGLKSAPGEFVSHGPAGSIERRKTTVLQESGSTLPPVEIPEAPLEMTEDE